MTLAVAVLASTGIRSQTPEWDGGFAGPGLGGRVFAMTEFRGELIAGGHVFRTDQLIQNVARFDGFAWQPLGAGVGGLNVPGAQRSVRALAVYNNELIVAGAFSTAGGRPANSIARWNGSTWAPLGPGVSGDNGTYATVHALAVYNGELWVGGDFTHVGAQPMPALARWDGTTWRAAGTFTPDILGNREVHSLEVVQTGLFAGGSFAAPGANIAHFNGTSWSPLGSGTDSVVRSLAVFRGQIIACGAFTTAGGSAAPGLATWNGSQWRSLPAVVTTGSSLYYSVETFRDRLYLTGRFGDASRNLVHVAQWDGTAWQGIGSLQGVVSGTLLTTGLCLHARQDRIVVGGEFVYALDNHPAGPGVASRNVVAFDGQHWLPVGEGGHGFNDVVQQLIPFAGGFVGVGDFDTAGTAVARGVAFFDGDRWHELGRFEGGTVRHVVAFQGELYVTGNFTSVDGQSIRRAARWDGARWNAWGNGSSGVLAVFQGRLHQGAADSLFVWNGNTRTQLARVPGEIDHLHVHQGALYVSAYNVFQPTVHRWDGAVMTQIATVDSQVATLGSFGADLVVGGAFSTIGGTAATRVARYDGSVWSAFGSGLGGGVRGTSVLATAVLEGVLYAGGNFGDGVRRWTGSTWQPLGTGIPSAVRTLLPDPADGSLWVGGSFYESGGLVADNLARWQTAPPWRDLLHGVPGGSGVPSLSGRGSLRVGTPFRVEVSRAATNAPLALIVGTTRADVPVLGGVLLPSPDVVLLLASDRSGNAMVAGTTPVLATGSEIYFQSLVLDPGAPSGIAFTNALRATVP